MAEEKAVSPFSLIFESVRNSVDRSVQRGKPARPPSSPASLFPSQDLTRQRVQQLFKKIQLYNSSSLQHCEPFTSSPSSPASLLLHRSRRLRTCDYSISNNKESSSLGLEDCSLGLKAANFRTRMVERIDGDLGGSGGSRASFALRGRKRKQEAETKVSQGWQCEIGNERRRETNLRRSDGEEEARASLDA